MIMKNRLNHKKHILLVDDEKSLTQMLSMLLETRGYDVQVACTAMQALQKVAPHYDLIILDLVLPDSSGFEVCRRLKQQKKTKHIPIIMISARSLQEDKVEGLYLGADDFLSKPCDHEELFARIEAVIRRNEPDYEKEGSLGEPNDAIICELRKVLDEGLIVPYFQPIYMLSPFDVYGFEILSRVKTDSSLSNPELLFKAALQFGMYTDMEMLSWSRALSLVGEHVTKEKIFLNCNPYFVEAVKMDRVLSLFEKNNVSIENTVLEITERSEISDFKLFFHQLRHYRDHGFSFAVDDVGGGYATLESIVETKPEVVKIDPHIILGIHADAFKQSVVRFIVSFCRENGIISIAEGIETKEDFETVKALGIDAGQGYYLYRPTPNPDLKKFRKSIS